MRSTTINQRLLGMLSDVWLIKPSAHSTLKDSLLASLTRAADSGSAAAPVLSPDQPERQFELRGNLAVIPVGGILMRKFSESLNDWGVTSTDVFERMVRVAGNDRDVGAVMLLFDSPGGYCVGIPEAARAVAAAAEAKPVIAYADGQMDSAAYWLASQASAIYATESAEVGCIGAYQVHVDLSRLYANEGYDVKVFRSGPHKGMGLPSRHLQDDQADMLQADVDATAAKFKAAVRTGRQRDIADDTMQGQCFNAPDALSRGLIDGIVDIDLALRDAEAMARMKTIRGR